MIDIILTYVQVFFGLLFFLYIPGYFVSEIFFEKLKRYEKVMLSVLFSLMIGMAIGVFFGYDRAQAELTGGFDADNIWIAELLLTSLLVFILVLKRIIRRHPLFAKKTKTSGSLVKKQIKRKKVTSR